MAAINALSTYNLSNSRLDRSHHRDLRHVACAVYVRMARYYDTHRKTGIVASLFGEETAMPYTMFASAVFFAPERHEDCEYRLDPIHIYRCQNGFWECMRIHGSRQKSSKLGEMMRACDQRLRLALDPTHPLKEEKVPKYLAKIIDDEIVAWLSWDAAHQPAKIDIDLSQLGHIRSVAAQTREALLIDEEREDDVLAEVETEGSEQPEAEPAADVMAEPIAAPTDHIHRTVWCRGAAARTDASGRIDCTRWHRNRTRSRRRRLSSSTTRAKRSADGIGGGEVGAERGHARRYHQRGAL